MTNSKAMLAFAKATTSGVTDTCSDVLPKRGMFLARKTQPCENTFRAAVADNRANNQCRSRHHHWLAGSAIMALSVVTGMLNVEAWLSPHSMIVRLWPRWLCQMLRGSVLPRLGCQFQSP